MKAGWEVKPLGELCDFQRGLTYAKSDEVPASNNIVLRANNVDLLKNELDLSDLRFISEAVQVPPDKKLRKGALLICTASGSKSHLGKVAYVEDDYGYAFGGFMGQITPVPGVDGRYLFHALTSPSYKDFIAALSDGANINNLKFADLRQFSIAVPPLEEQRRIVAILDEAFDGLAAAKANAQKNLLNARELIGNGYAAITDSLDRSAWVVSPVKSIAEARKGSMRTGPFGSQLLHSEFVDDGVAVLGIDNAVANEFRWDRHRFITEEKYRNLSRYRVFPGDVLITIMGTCGRCAVVPDDIPVAINTKHLCCISLDRKKCLPEFLHAYFLYDPTARDYLDAHAKGSIMAGLNMGIISELPVHLPSLEVQRSVVSQFAKLVDLCERLIQIQQQKLTALDDLKKSLLHQAFTGQL